MVKRQHRRRALAGILSALFLFAMLFTAGATFFLGINQFRHQEDIANANREALQQNSAIENLSLAVSFAPTGGNLILTVNNTGGVPSSIVEVFVTGTTGNLLSNSASGNSHFLGEAPDLTVSLPLSLAVGASTSMMSGCGGTDCNLEVSSAAFSYSSYLSTGANPTILVSVLTALGNVFSVEYPASGGSLKNVIIVNQQLIDQLNVEYSQVNLSDQSVVVNCYECSTNLASGGNILVTQLIATPSPVSDGGTITLTGTVWNYSPYTASKVNLTLSAVYAGFAYVTPNLAGTSEVCGSATSITTQASATFTCTFTAHAGGSNGAITFTGSSEGCIKTGNTTNCASGSLANSASTSSNPVQVGVVVSFGPWQLNYYYFQYTDASHTTPSSPAIVTGSDHDAAFSVKLTNIYGSDLTVLDGSYLQFVSPGTDVDEYIVQGVSYSPTSVTPYGCSDSPPSAPTGTCVTVSAGQTVTLSFAASSAGGSSWEWANSNPGGQSGVGCTVQIIIEYALSSGGSYSIYAQDLPFQSVYIQ